MPAQKTKPHVQSFEAHLATWPPNRQDEARALDTIFRRVTGFLPCVWTGGLVGYGQYRYTYASGHSGESLATGFAARRARLSVYILPGYTDFSDILTRLGPHKTGNSCLYLTRLERVDTKVLAELIAAGLRDLATRWTIQPT